MIQNLQAMVDGIQRKTPKITTQTSREKLPSQLPDLSPDKSPLNNTNVLGKN
jgi:hypothetical protein